MSPTPAPTPIRSSRHNQQQRLQQLDALGFELVQHQQHHHQHRLHHLRHEQHLREELSNRQPPDIDNNNYARNNHITGTLTERKEKLLGRPEAVIDARRQLEKDRALANKHMEEISCDKSCLLPQKRYVSVASDPSKIYTPHCTSVYRCAEDSGCCARRTEICAPKRSHKFERRVHVKGPKDRHSTVETLILVNHTECHCIERSNYYAEGVLQSNNPGLLQRATILNCNCPAPFEKILQDNDQCRCDCSSGNDGCEFLKSGREHFSMKNRKCIQHGHCKPPTCQYGEYMKKHGRCPNQQEQLPQHQQLSYNTLS
ncbi:GH11681 [Drosophila grimshawi]|uniref:GH11681 n=1 Tax=Drosophila grimshawi TaxID=7222 RepID=B4JCQ9_DROGR|nr:GH11681 [Drosophila grimshawi]